MKFEDIAYYVINESIHLTNLHQDEDYLMDFKKMLYMLFLIECEYMKQTNSPLFTEDFFLSSNGIAIGIEKNNTFDISLSKHIEQRLFIFEDIKFNKYTHTTFEIHFDKFTQKIVDDVLAEYGFLSLNLLKEMFIGLLKLRGVYNFTLIEKEKMKLLFETESFSCDGSARKRELNV